jgi:hypothetical protein
MAVGFPVKDDYATGDVLTAANMNDFAGTLNTVPDVVGGFAAGKNKIINGDFNINQRAFTSTTTSGAFGFDRWFINAADGTVTYSKQTFTAGAAPIAGYESTNFARVQTAGQTTANANAQFRQRIEDVRTVTPGQNFTVSFFAKAASGTPKAYIELEQSFGTGGSPSSAVIIAGSQVTLSTLWARYSITIAIPSISGKTVGTTTPGNVNLNMWLSAGTDFNARTGSLGIQTNTFDIWGVQVEAGSIATPFQPASGTIGGELALCQRYYFRTSSSTNGVIGIGNANTTTTAGILVNLPQRMRAIPSATIDFSNLRLLLWGVGAVTLTNATLDAGAASVNAVAIAAEVASGLTANYVYTLGTTSSAGYLGISAEL